jgi:hypothetical protein
VRRLPKIGWASEATPATIFIDQGRPSQNAIPAASAGESWRTCFWKKRVATPVTALAP